VTSRPAFELADVFRRHRESYDRANAGHLGRVERRVIGAITACRTAALGGHVERCEDCGLTRIAYNSWRNRHCPKCQSAARAEWLASRQAELLPVPYFHVVFTLPPAAAEIAFQNKQTIYGLLMRAAAQALMTRAAKRLSARIGLIAVLHTWGQTLTHHPHVHCLVSGGGVALDGLRWVACKPNFLLSVHALSRTFRRIFLEGLEAAFRRGGLGFFGDLAPLADPGAFAERGRALRKTPFVVYAKPPFGGPERVLAYLARYWPLDDCLHDLQTNCAFSHLSKGPNRNLHIKCPGQDHQQLCECPNVGATFARVDLVSGAFVWRN
jgi:Transposase zinc-binding domain/Putative transposase